MEKDIRKIQLPKDSSAENIETLSRKKFEILFDEERFILKPEIIDNGVDYRAEIKIDGTKTGYGFIFQLKSKHEASINQDGSYSKSIFTSNIEYLLNNGQPAFYGFYLKDSDEFYYTYLNDEIARLNKLNPKWQKQKSHVFRFSKLINQSKVNNLYEIAYSYGDMLRQVNIGRAIMQGYEQYNSSLIIDDDDTVTDEREIIEMIEALGMELINNGRWTEIIEVHRTKTTNKQKPSRYNLVLGIAYYYKGNYMTSLTFFNDVKVSDLLKVDQNYFRYYIATVEYGIGYLTIEEYQERIKDLEKGTLLGLFLRLTKAPSILTESNHKKSAYSLYVQEIDSIIQDPKATNGLKQSCRNQAALYEGYEICGFYLESVSQINSMESFTGPNLELRSNVINEFIKRMNDWEEQFESAKKESWNSKNWFAYHQGLIHQAHVKYYFAVYTDNFQVTQDFPGEEVPSAFDHKPMLEAMLKQVNVAVDYFNKVEFIENRLLGTKGKYELEVYLGLTDEAQISLNILEELSFKSGSKKNMDAYRYLIKAGTFEKQIKVHLSEIKGRVLKREKEMQNYEQEMKTYDDEDRKKEPLRDDFFVLQFVPIGFFSYPIDDFDIVLKYLNVEKKAIKSIKYLMSQSIIPVLNLFYDPIPEMGYLDKNPNMSTPDEWLKIFKIRRWFYQNGYLRKFI